MTDSKSKSAPTATPYKPKVKPAAAAKKTFARPVAPEKTGTVKGGQDKPSRPYARPVREDVEGKGGVTAVVSVGTAVVVSANGQPKRGAKRTLRQPEPPPAPPVASGPVTAGTPATATVRVSVQAVPLRKGEATQADYVPPAFRWPPAAPKAIVPPEPPGESALRALAAAAAAAPVVDKT